MTPEEVLKQWGELTSYSNTVYRLVETQEQSATYSLVDNLEEQAVLEEIIDDYKPPYPEETQARHYLIKTPFRYPPLKYGSRFGTRAELSFFYASEDPQACLAEAAYYRFLFFDAMDTPYADKVHSAHQLFSVDVITEKAVDLTLIHDKAISEQLLSKSTYSFTQRIGKVARDNGAQLIRFFSARYVAGINVAIDTPAIITSHQPESILSVQCETLPHLGVVRFSVPKEFPVTYHLERFLVDGRLPYPAA